MSTVTEAAASAANKRARRLQAWCDAALDHSTASRDPVVEAFFTLERYGDWDRLRRSLGNDDARQARAAER